MTDVQESSVIKQTFIKTTSHFSASYKISSMKVEFVVESIWSTNGILLKMVKNNHGDNFSRQVTPLLFQHEPCALVASAVQAHDHASTLWHPVEA